jgi:hypothetical protein
MAPVGSFAADSAAASGKSRFAQRKPSSGIARSMPGPPNKPDPLGGIRWRDTARSLEPASDANARNARRRSRPAERNTSHRAGSRTDRRTARKAGATTDAGAGCASRREEMRQMATMIAREYVAGRTASHLSGALGMNEAWVVALLQGQGKVLERCRRGESDLVYRDRTWFLIATVDVPDAALNTDPVDFLGVDMGIVNIATTSEGHNFEGAGLRRYRKRQAKVRAELQAKATKSAKKKLKARARKEARTIAHTNHKIAKELVAEAERTGRGVRYGRPSRYPRPGTAPSRPARRVALVVVPSTPGVHRLQGPPGRGAGGRDRRPAHLAAMPLVSPYRAGQPARAERFRLSRLRSRWTRRHGSRGQRP